MSRDLRLEAAIRGDLARYMAEELKSAEAAVTGGVRDTARGLKEGLRADVRAGGLGNRLAKTWRDDYYPRRGTSLRAAATVYSKAPDIIRAFEGSTIRSSDGNWLAIPTRHAPKRGVGRKRISPATWPDHRYGPLRFVMTRKGRAVLVVDNQRRRKGKSGGFTRSRSKKALASGKGLKTVPMFILVPQVRLKRRLNVEAVTAREAANLARNIDARFRQQDAKGSRS